MKESLARSYKNIFNFSKSASRSEFWMNFLFYISSILIRVAICIFIAYKKDSDILLVSFYFTMPIDFLFLLVLFSAHVRLVNAHNKKLWHFFIPLYNLWFLFAKTPAELPEPTSAKRYWLIPFSIIICIFNFFTIDTFFVGCSIFGYEQLKDWKHEKQLEAMRIERKAQEEQEKARLEEQKAKLATKIPANADPVMNFYNYDFARYLYSVCYDIRDLDEFYNEEDGIEYFSLEGNRVVVTGMESLYINNNNLIQDSEFQIGDYVEHIYSVLGGLEYNEFNDTEDIVKYYIWFKYDEDLIESKVVFIISDRKIVRMEAEYEILGPSAEYEIEGEWTQYLR